MTTKQQAYERERKVQNEWATADFEKERMLEALYNESIKRMQQQIDDYYLSYATRSGLTRAEAYKRIQNFDVQAWAEKAAEAVKNKDFSPHTNDWLRTYNSKMYISRVELLKAELEIELQSMLSEQHALMDSYLIEEALKEYRRQAGILGGSATGSVERIKRIVDADFYGANFSERIWGRNGQYDVIRRELFGSLNRFYTDMRGYRKERQHLMNFFGVSKSEAMRLLRTETARVRASAEMESYRDNNATHYIYMAESGACAVCADLDGLAIPVDEAEIGVNMFPMHPNCRCSSYGHREMKYKDGRSTLDEFSKWNKSN